jgi:hypothetical protein
MLLWPITDLVDEERCYEYLRAWLYPDGLVCPRGHLLPPNQAPHDRHRAPILDYRCRRWGAVFNLFTGTVFSKTRYSCRIILQLLRGIAQGVPTKHLAEELHVDRGNHLARRPAIQALLEQRLSPLGPGRCGHGSR